MVVREGQLVQGFAPGPGQEPPDRPESQGIPGGALVEQQNGRKLVHRILFPAHNGELQDIDQGVAKLVHQGKNQGPSHQELAAGFSPEPVRKALKQLVTEGYPPVGRVVGGIGLGTMRRFQDDVPGDPERVVEPPGDGIQEAIGQEPGPELGEIGGCRAIAIDDPPLGGSVGIPGLGTAQD